MSPPTRQDVHPGSEQLTADLTGSRSSKLKKLELLAAKRYLNPPKFSYGRDHQHVNNHPHHHHHTSPNTVTKSTVQSNRPSDVKEPEVDLIETSPKRPRVHRLTPTKHKSSNAKILVLDPRIVNKETTGKRVEPPELIPFQKTDHTEEVPPEVVEAVEETQDLEDRGPIITENELENTQKAWNDHEDLMKEDFPSLKIAHRISPGDKFFKSLQKEKTKYAKPNDKGKTKDKINEQLASPIQEKGNKNLGETDLNNEKPDVIKNLASNVKSTPASSIVLKSLESTLNEVDKIEELTNTPTRSSRKRNKLSVIADESSNKDSGITKSPKSVKNGSSNKKQISQTKNIDSSLAKEMNSMRGIRDTSPTPIKRKKRTAENNLPTKIKKVKLLQTEEAKLLFDEASEKDDIPFDKLKKVKLLHTDEVKLLFEEDSQNADSTPFGFEDDAVNVPSSPVKQNLTSESLMDETYSEIQRSTTAEDVEELKQIILKRLAGQLPPLELYGLEDQYHQLYRMLKNTIKNQEGNSCLIVGPSGTAKRTTVKKVIEDLNEKYGKQFITVRLSGAVQTDEKLAIRSIAQQIDDAISTYQESEQQELKITDLRNSNRTLRALLKVLDQNDLNDYKTKMIDRNLSVAIVFIIDEFHKFTEYNRQSLLYNLFDLSQNSNTPISVVGLTTKITTREMLEKRVKSRFSQKIIMFNKPLVVENFIQQFLQNGMVKKSEVSNTAYGEAYNNFLTKHAMNVSSPLHKFILFNYFTIKSVKECLTSLIIPIAQMNRDNIFPDFSSLIELEDPYSNEITRKIKSLSDLELSLLLACSRIVFKSELNVVDFNSCYNEYHAAMRGLKLERISAMTNFESSTGVVIDLKIWPKSNTKKAWELLQKLELIVDNNLKKVNQNQSFTAFSVVVTLEELRKAIDKQSPLHPLTII